MKITQEQVEKGNELMQTLVKKAWESTTFKEQLISNPVETIDALFGNKTEPSKDISVVVEDQTDTSIIYLNIPAKPNLEELELTDEILEMISGGYVNPFADLGYVIVDSLCEFCSHFHPSNR